MRSQCPGGHPGVCMCVIVCVCGEIGEICVTSVCPLRDVAGRIDFSAGADGGGKWLASACALSGGAEYLSRRGIEEQEREGGRVSVGRKWVSSRRPSFAPHQTQKMPAT